MAFSTVSATSSHIPIHNYSQSILNEVKKFYKHVNQLNILLKETNNACRELKSLQQSSVLSEDMENLQINDLDEKFIKALQKKKICLVILGQNALAQSILVNELLGRYLLPFEINTTLKEENWRFVRIKHSKIGGYTYQLVESEFEVMSSEQLNKKFTFATPSKQVSSLPGTNTRVGMSKSNSPKNSSSSLSKSSQNQLLVGSSNNSSSNFTIPIDVLRLDEGLIRARTRVDEAKTLAEIDAARDRLVEVEAIAENHAILEVTLDLKLLENNFEILVHSRSMKKSILECILADVIPVYVYGIIEPQLSDQDAKELSRLKSIVNGHPILFVKIPEVDQYIDRMPSPSPQSVDSSSQTKKANALLKYLHQVSSQQITHTHVSDSSTSSSFEVFKHLCDLGYLNALSTINEPGGNSGVDDYLNEQRSNSEVSLIRDDGVSTRLWVIQSEFCEKWHLFMPIFCTYLKRYLKSFSARDMLVTPRKIEYAREKEQILYESLISLASMKQEELKNLINSAIETHREQILDEVRSFQFVDVELISCRESPTQEIIGDELSADSISSSSTPSPRPASSCEEPISAFDSSKQFLTVRYARDYKKCTSQIQELVISRLNNAIAQKLIESVEILKENYLGTLKRCLITLEEMNLGPNTSFSEANSASVSEALQQIVNAAYHVELNISGSSSFVKILILRMKELIKNMPWSASPKLDEEWKVQIAANMLNSLSESKLAKILCNQMKERLKSSHNLFTNSLRLLELRHTGRLEKNEENQALIRKILAPKFAKLCLESTSLKDYVLYGFPSLGREIGRGQYGVVYSCARWGRYENLAVKSVVPPDEKHWNDLALEFHYTKQIADHERIVKLLGSVIDYTYGNGQSPAVLLIMEAMKRDLYSALKSGLDWKTRVRISIDVVHGIRYLHSLGLVHRDIKLKNVLLDEKNRAKITDLGFCKPEAMMSGSIVGTPVHMCPEMFNSKYDNTVDIYAFGILFWYICAGAVTLPKNFETCGTKDDLWSAVKRGVRPERLPIFDEDSWRLMEMCWRHDPKQRPHIGVVNDQLMAIMAKYDA